MTWRIDQRRRLQRPRRVAATVARATVAALSGWALRGCQPVTPLEPAPAGVLLQDQLGQVHWMRAVRP